MCPPGGGIGGGCGAWSRACGGWVRGQSYTTSSLRPDPSRRFRDRPWVGGGVGCG
ncbi:hypothetical protein T261_2659 [Streptomyces lydicus]|nr:hypothetical protein T261_2659 [Streptomyces lydicus]